MSINLQTELIENLEDRQRMETIERLLNDLRNSERGANPRIVRQLQNRDTNLESRIRSLEGYKPYLAGGQIRFTDDTNFTETNHPQLDIQRVILSEKNNQSTGSDKYKELEIFNQTIAPIQGTDIEQGLFVHEFEGHLGVTATIDRSASNPYRTADYFRTLCISLKTTHHGVGPNGADLVSNFAFIVQVESTLALTDETSLLYWSIPLSSFNSSKVLNQNLAGNVQISMDFSFAFFRRSSNINDYLNFQSSLTQGTTWCKNLNLNNSYTTTLSELTPNQSFSCTLFNSGVHFYQVG